jgi:hypothetical protein
MALHTHLPIHRTGTDLLGLAARIYAQMPRGFKRTVGDKIMSHCSEMLDLMALANASRGEQRGLCIREILRHARAVTVWLRVGFDLRAPNPVIPQELWANAVQMVDSVGKQANGWLNKTNEKAPAA